MKKKYFLVLLITLFIIFLTSLLVYLQTNSKSEQQADGSLPAAEEKGESTVEYVKVKIFFFRETSDRRVPIDFELPLPRNKLDLYHSYVDLLLKGKENYCRPVPDAARLESLFFLEAQKLLILNLNEDLVRKLLPGTESELEFVRYLVDNICFNFSEIKKVKFLVGGLEPQTLTGHLDFENAFYPELSSLQDEE